VTSIVISFLAQEGKSRMSEYQYYEWQTVDRLLTAKEQAEVNELSSHIMVSSSKAVVTYNWSSFRHDPQQVLLRYFDAHFYYANWGSLNLMFKFPKGTLNRTDALLYCDNGFVQFKEVGDYQVLEISLSSDDGDSYMEESESTLSDFIALRADLIDGDYRLLYLAWLMSGTLSENPDLDYEDEDDDEDYDEDDGEEEEEDVIEKETLAPPPVPAGLKKLTPALQNFVDAFGVNAFLVQAAAESSPDLRETPVADYPAAIAQLPRQECNEYLARLAEGDPGVRAALRKRLKAFFPHADARKAEARSLQDLVDRSRQLEIEEKQRRVREARRKHVAEMQSLAQREPRVWQQVEELLANGQRIASVYDEVTQHLEKLEQLADFQGTRDIFIARVRDLAVRYAARPALMGRWRKHGWV
jgi:hypothetical protein